jgi:hypothetical protein
MAPGGNGKAVDSAAWMPPAHFGIWKPAVLAERVEVANGVHLKRQQLTMQCQNDRQQGAGDLLRKLVQICTRGRPRPR